MILAILFALGLVFGSFVNALVWRVHTKKDIVRGRSQCIYCGHLLSPSDLMPVLSWLILRGKCRYCQKPISRQYPIVEIALGLIFALSYYYWPVSLQGGQWVLFISWLMVSVGLLALAVYDLRWMLLPSVILYPIAAIAAIGRLAYIVGFEAGKGRALLAWLVGVVAASGIFWLIYEFSRGKAIGFGDVRLGLISGTILADPLYSLEMIFAASILGTVVILPGLISHQKSLSTKIPYGPFLILATFIVLLFGSSFTNWYQNLFIY